jgi:SNF2 family DNA or RNA helicase
MRRSSFQRGVSTLNREEISPARLAAWQITGLLLSPVDALTFLSQLGPHTLADSPTLAPNLRHARIGNDLRFWSHAAKYVLEILTGQHFLPGMAAESTGRFRAVWKPALMDVELRRRLEALVETMPPICRAYEIPSPDQAVAPGMLMEHFLAALVDRAVRTWLANHPQPQGDSAAIHWLGSLLSQSGRMHLPPQPAHELYHDWAAWIEQLHSNASDANFHLTFQLRPPLPREDQASASENQWSLHYYLQSREHPEIMVSAGQIWQEKGQTLRINGRRFDQPQERLLAGLGIASRMFPPIKESLRSPRPEMALLTTQDAYQFLKEIGPLLESSGFGVMLPEWWKPNRRSRLGLRLQLFGDALPAGQAERRAKRERAAKGKAESAVRFRWHLTLGNDSLSREEFEQLVAMLSPLINIRGEWVELDPAQVRAAEEFLTSAEPEGKLSLLQAMRMAQAYADADQIPNATQDLLSMMNLQPGIRSVLPLDTVQVDGWLDDVLRRLRDQDRMEALEEPEGFKGTLRPYQRRGLAWLHYLRQIGMGACLADDMGLGKTIQAIALMLHTRNQRAALEDRVAPALLICPTSVVSNWRHEMERFAPGLKSLVHHGSGRLSGPELMQTLDEVDLIITSYGTARRDIETLSSFVWSDVILDEAQNIKNPSAKQTQAVRRLNADNRVALTGTPVENRLLELWSIMEFLNPGYLGQRERFRQHYVLPIERYNDTESLTELRRVVQPFLLRRLKTDPTIIDDLPEKNEMVVYCPLTKEQATLYNQVVQTTMDQVDQSEGIQRRGLVLSLLMKLKQVCNHPAHFLGEKDPIKGRSGKLSRLTEMLEEALSVGDRALVFTQFVEMGHLLQRHLQETLGCEVIFLHGGTPATKRDQMVQAFQEGKKGPPIFILSLRAGGVGLNLTRANHVFHFDRWWNPAVENQATDRAFRIGQQRRVQVYKFVVAGTLEERIHELIENKQNLAESIVGSGEDWLTEMDVDELRRILVLRREEVEDEVMA